MTSARHQGVAPGFALRRSATTPGVSVARAGGQQHARAESEWLAANRNVVTPAAQVAAGAEHRRPESNRPLVLVVERIRADRLRRADRQRGVDLGVVAELEGAVELRVHPKFGEAAVRVEIGRRGGGQVPPRAAHRVVGAVCLDRAFQRSPAGRPCPAGRGRVLGRCGSRRHQQGAQAGHRPARTCMHFAPPDTHPSGYVRRSLVDALDRQTACPATLYPIWVRGQSSRSGPRGVGRFASRASSRRAVASNSSTFLAVMSSKSLPTVCVRNRKPSAER